MPSTMVIFAHPDDEVIALGGRLERFGGAHFVHVTDGAPRNGEDCRAHGFGSLEEYRRAREAEFAAALEGAGIGAASRECLGIADQEASLNLGRLTEQIGERLRRLRPEVVFTHPYEGGHPDHDATAFAVQAAVRMSKARGEKAPVIVEAPFYHAGPRGMRTGEFLPGRERTHEIAYSLGGEEQQRKRKLLACFGTQGATLAAFGVEWERFRVAPGYDFRQRPHAGATLYDGFPWGMNSERFCELAAEAEEAMQQDEELVPA
ncbi:MAG TPA: PIG-L family deacetylase [Acidobacteriaceae bacterium]|nr:PIG-L family deacetylase [Acidobacteriaceae bacterium]